MQGFRLLEVTLCWKQGRYIYFSAVNGNRVIGLPVLTLAPYWGTVLKFAGLPLLCGRERPLHPEQNWGRGFAEGEIDLYVVPTSGVET